MMPRPWTLSGLALVLLAVVRGAWGQAVVPFPTLRVNCGGIAAFTDSQGRVWEADQSFTSGAPFDAGIAIVDAPLYGTERFFNEFVHAAPFQYDIPVPDGEYGIALHFAEVFFQIPQARVFDVWVEGILVRDGLDLFVEAGFATPYQVFTTAIVTDGMLTIELGIQVENPKISGIEVFDIVNFDAPTAAPTTSPAPSMTPTTAAPSISRAPTPAENIYINCGGGGYLNNAGDAFWQADTYFQGGGVYINGANPITPTLDDTVYISERFGEFAYEIPVPVATYDVTIHLAELFWTQPGQRLFTLTIEDTVFENVDIVAIAQGAFISTSLQAAVVVSDGFLSISVANSFPAVDQGKISGIEVKLLGPHLAHAVAGGPYRAVDTTNTGSADVPVNADQSHTHGIGSVLTSWTWRLGATILGTGEITTLTLPVGEHSVVLTVIDDAGFENSEMTTFTVLPFGYPAVTSISPNSGNISGGDVVTIVGSGYTYSAAETTVHFGLVDITGSALTIIDEFTIQLIVPPTVVGAPVAVSVETPLEVSNSVLFNYIGGVPINFDTSLLLTIDSPTTAKFGPDRSLYVGTINGNLARVLFNEDFTQVVDMVVSKVSEFRAILGIAFNPLDEKAIPDVYISTSFFFHGDPTSSSGDSINGDIRKISGANLDVVEDVITGLPISDHDHGINNIEFGNNGELYFAIGSNTNGGVPGALSGSQLQKENFYSAAINVAYLADPGFDGQITYDAPDDGSPNGGFGIEVFAPGTRNPFGLTLHSSGKLYATDNGPNLGFGDMSTGCGPNDFVSDIEEEDKFLFIEKDNYYGHPNPKRASDLGDPRQCVWRSQTEPSDADYTAPMVITPASTGGLIEYAYDHFGGQLRGNLIASMYQGPLLRVILDPSGEGIIPQSSPPLLLVNADTSLNVGEDGLDVTQAPNGNLVECRISDSTIYVHKPVEPATTAMSVKGVFPHRGSTAGGSILDIYGVNFVGIPTILVGNQACPVVSTTTTKIECTLPPGAGLVDVVVTIGPASSAFTKGYRYVTGQPAGPATNSPTSGPTTTAPTISPTTVAPVAATSVPVGTTGPTTLAPAATTAAPIGSVSPTSLAPVSVAPTSAAPSTLAPIVTSSAPTTLAPVMATSAPAISTSSPTTLAPVMATSSPIVSTSAPTTLAPVVATSSPIVSTSAPTTLAPVVATSSPIVSTVAPTTVAPVVATLSPTTMAPTGAPIVIPTLPPTTLTPTAAPLTATSSPTSLAPTDAPISNTSQPTAGSTPPFQQAFDYAIATRLVSVNDQTTGVGKVELNIRLGERDVQNGVFGWRSQKLKNTGGKRIAAAFIDLTNAMFQDIVFDPDGAGGDDIGKPLTHDWGTTETRPISTGSYVWKWLPARSDPGFNPSAPFNPNDLSNVNNLFVDALSDSGKGAAGGYRGELILFREFDSGEEYEFSQDLDPNSIAGLRHGTVGQHAEWDVGGVSAAEMIHSKITILFGDGSVASGTISSDGSQGGGIAVVSSSLGGAPGLRVDGFTAPASGTYAANPSSVVVSSQPGDTVRVSVVSAFDPTDNFEVLLANTLTPEQLVTARLEAQYPNFPVTNARSWQHVEVVIPGSGSLDIGNQLQYSDDFALGFTAVVIGQDGSPTSYTTDPIRLLHV